MWWSYNDRCSPGGTPATRRRGSRACRTWCRRPSLTRAHPRVPPISAPSCKHKQTNVSEGNVFARVTRTCRRVRTRRHTLPVRTHTTTHTHTHTHTHTEPRPTHGSTSVTTAARVTHVPHFRPVTRSPRDAVAFARSLRTSSVTTRDATRRRGSRRVSVSVVSHRK